MNDLDILRAFAQDRLALHLCKEGLSAREDLTLSEPERVFFYLPLEHSEDAGDQARAVELMAALHLNARPGYEDYTLTILDYAKRHRDVIREFGRFPHRNALLGRSTTVEEQAFLNGGGFAG